MKLVISSKNKNLVIFNGQNLVLDGSFSCIDVDEDSFFYVYPIDCVRNLIPFAFSVKKFDNQFVCDCSHIKTTNFPNYLELEILPFSVPDEKMPCTVNEFYSPSNENTKIHVEIFDCEKNNLHISTGVNYFCDSLFGFEESSINYIEHFIVISYKAKSCYYIYVFNAKNNCKVLHCEIAQFELSPKEKKLVIVEKLNDSLSHAKIIEILFGDNFQMQTVGLTYLDENRETICKEIAFFDCIKAGNFKLAQSLMTPNLKAVLSIEAAKEYFKDFCAITQSKIDFKFYLLDNKSPQTATEACFEFKDNLINNIKILYNLEKKDDN